jgi:hypothetical protein
MEALKFWGSITTVLPTKKPKENQGNRSDLTSGRILLNKNPLKPEKK